MTNSAEILPSLIPAVLQSNSFSSRPFLINDSSTDRAQKVKQLLLDLSKETEEQELKSALRRTAEFFRESFFGLTEKQIRTRIKNCLEDYFDGDEYRGLEIDNIAEETGIEAEKLLPILNKMVKQKIIVQGRRRRWNELGEHYNALYKLAD